MKKCKICLITTVAIFSLTLLFSQYCFAAQQSASQNSGVSKGLNIPDIQPPSIPGNLSAVNRTHTTILLNWTNSNDNVGVRGYQLFRNGKKIITTSKTSYTDRDLIPGQLYTYSVKAYDAAGNISESGESLCIATVADTQPPTVPGLPMVSSVDFTTISLTWKPSTDNTGVKRYEIYMCGTRKASTSATSYTCKGLSPGKTYNFTIRAFDMAGNCSSSSTTVYADTLKDVSTPSIPQGLKAASISETEVSLVWSPSSDNVKVKEYEVYCDGKKIGTTSKTTCTYTKLVPGKGHVFTIRAVDTSGLLSAASTSIGITALKDWRAPTIPSSLKIRSVSKSTVSLSWNTSIDNIKVKGYNVYCNGSVIATTTRTTRSVKIPSGLGIGIYWVRAYDQSDNLSEKSNIVTAFSFR